MQYTEALVLNVAKPAVTEKWLSPDKRLYVVCRVYHKGYFNEDVVVELQDAITGDILAITLPNMIGWCKVNEEVVV